MRACVRVSHLLYPLSHRQTLRLIPDLGPCGKCYSKRQGSDTPSRCCSHFLWKRPQRWSSWIIRQFYFPVFEEPLCCICGGCTNSPPPPPPPVHNGPFLHIAASTRLVSLDDGRSNRCGVRLHWGPGLHLPDC